MRKILKFTLFISLFFIASNAIADNDSVSKNIQPKIQKTLQQYLDKHKTDEHISAIVVTISPSPEKMQSFAVGSMQYENQNNPAKTDDLFQIGSITKSFTSVVILQLAEQGKLSLDDKLAKYFPEYTAWKNVTVRQLLNMTSGIPNYSDLPSWSKQAGENIQTAFTPSQLVQLAENQPMTSGYHYTNTGYILAGMIAEKVSGKSFIELMRNLISQVKLQNTDYYESVYPQAIIKNMVSGYYYNLTDPNLNRLILSTSDSECRLGTKSTDIKCSDMSWAGAAGGIVANTEDVTSWARTLFTVRHVDKTGNDVGILASQQLKDLESLIATDNGKSITRTDIHHPNAFGLGVVQASKPELGTYWYYVGETLGYRVLYAYFPKKISSNDGQGLIITIALNSQPVPCLDHIGDLVMAIYKNVKQPIG